MRTDTIDRVTVALKRAEAESLELIARRLRQEASELEHKLFTQMIGRAPRSALTT
jgi:hypothetical protein